MKKLSRFAVGLSVFLLARLPNLYCPGRNGEAFGNGDRSEWRCGSDAAVKAVNANTRVVAETRSDSDGNYAFTACRRLIELTVKQGFKSRTLTGYSAAGGPASSD